MYTVEMASYGMIYLPVFVKIHIGVQAISTFSSRIGCDVDITDGRDL